MTRRSPLVALALLLTPTCLLLSQDSARQRQPVAAQQRPDVLDTKMLAAPAVSANHVAFVYADDLWVTALDGKAVRRLTTDAGVGGTPVFAPNGKTIAFTAIYHGNPDVFTVPVEGGTPQRLTAHPGPDVVRGFTPDGSAVLFSSPRSVFSNRYNQLFTVPLQGGFPTQLPIPNATSASYSPDGNRIAYNPLSDSSAQWKNYRGGTIGRIWIFDFKSQAMEQIPQPQGGCNDLDPRWLGDKVYFRSDRDGEYNVYSYDAKTKYVTPITKHTDFPVLALGANAGGNGSSALIYEQAGHLHLLNPESAKSTRLAIGVAADLRESMPRFVKGNKFARNAVVSPSGARAAFEFRGEIVTIPAEKGDPRNLTNSTGAHDRDPAWSPDGLRIAYFSDVQGGEYQLFIRNADGKGEPKSYKLTGAGFYSRPSWSPDGKKLCYVDNSQSLYCLDLDSGECKKIASEPFYGPVISIRGSWSPDSKWVTYTTANKTALRTVYVYSVADDKSRPVTDGMSDSSEPCFDASGKYLYFLSSTQAGPVRQWFAQSNADMRDRNNVYLAVLAKGVSSPLAKESDEEKAKKEDEKAAKEAKEPAKDDAKKDEPKKEEAKKDDKKEVTCKIDFEGLDQRILALPLPPAEYAELLAGKENSIYFLEMGEPKPGQPRGGKLHHYDLSKRKDETILENVADFAITRDGKKVMYFTAPETWCITELASTLTPGKGKLKVDAIEVRIEPREEWAQIYDEAWRINRDYFYATNFHGADWNAVRKKYAAMLPHVATRSDLNRVIRWMCSELAVGHSYLGGGDRLIEPKRVPGGLLGADYEIANGRFKFKKVYGGLNWNPSLRAPLTAPGVDVKAGEFLLAVNGKDLKADDPTGLYALFENTAGKLTEITVGPNADGTGSRTVSVEPLEDEFGLRNRDWVERNLRKVHEATKGRVAYVYVPNTAGAGHEYFKRYFFPQVDKEAVIVDERFNGGGQVADYYIDILRRPFTAHWATRYGQDIVTPGAAIFGPKVMIIDETAGSGGDLLPWMFRKYQLGKLVGKRTWGGLVGILGFPVLMDGGQVTAPNLAIWTEDGWIVENVGVPPDIEVEQNPADVIAGKDPQLDKAIQIVMEELEKNPPKTPQRPPFPVRARTPGANGTGGN